MSFLSRVCPCAFGDDAPPPRPTPPQPTAANPWTIGPIVNGQNFSQGMPLQPAPNGDGTFSFDFPTAKPGVHGVTRPWGSVAGGSITMHYRIDGNAQFVPVDPNDAGNPVVRLFLQRSGDDWGGPNTGKSSYRFYSGPAALIADGMVYVTQVALSPEAWTNVDGQQDPAGFAAVLADLATVGFGIGGMFAMHGAIASGPARFTILAFNLS